jgi:peptide/nickel transport system substrate-binding protein
MLDTVLLGYGVIGDDNPVPPTSPYAWRPEAQQRDLEGAKALLAEAGYSGDEIALSYPDFTYSGINMGTFAQKVQADLQEAGMNVTLKPAEVQVALEAYRQGTEPFGLWFWLPDYADSNDYLEFLPGRLVGLRTGWTDENADQAILDIRDAALVETNTDARVPLFEQMQDYLIESGPYAPVVQPGVQVGLSPAVKGFVYNLQWRVDLAQLSK